MQLFLNTSVRCMLSTALVAGYLSLPSMAFAQETDYSQDDEIWQDFGEKEDPWEQANRAVFRFNDVLDRWALKPLAKGYQKVTPDVVEDGVHNVFRNLGEVRNLTNNLLQLKMHDAGIDTARFFFNTSFGLLGFFDVATKMGLQRNDEDFGQTLGSWGVKSGPYLVLPFFGPSTVRDTASLYTDTYVSAYRYINDVPVRNSMYGLNIVDTRASLLSAERLIAGDKYRFIRNAYLQNREFKVLDGNVVDDF
ncbi:VacJ family lipoprotein [Denitrificimonas caeni]|uniref:MlaA family lipoprotein n=1 Tax=Denitrificimonas caeni TaxID=521720 RepID=UPI001E5BFC9B|nr:VacJ family lipoprotein [Denitrificimonas caeni]